MYVIMNRKDVKTEILSGLMIFLGWILVIDLALLAAEISFLAYMQEEVWPLITKIYSGPLLGSLILQVVVGSFIPLMLILIPRVRTSIKGVLVTCLLVLIGVYAYRWSTVIGGQLLPKMQAKILTYVASPYEIYGSIFSLVVAFTIIGILSFILPWRGTAHAFSAKEDKPVSDALWTT